MPKRRRLVDNPTLGHKKDAGVGVVPGPVALVNPVRLRGNSGPVQAN